MSTKRQIPKSILPSGPTRLPVVEETDEMSPVQCMARRIRELYVERRRKFERATGKGKGTWTPGKHWDGGKTDYGMRKSIWFKLAKFCVKHRLDPEDYIDSMFSESEPNRIPPPNYFLSENVMQAYVDSRCNTEDRLEFIKLAFEDEQLKLHVRISEWTEVAVKEKTIDKNEIQRAILGDDDLGLTALFRFCLAIREKIDDIAEYYMEAAFVQYLKFPEEYQQVWGDFLPPWLDEWAVKCRADFLAERDGD